MPSPSVKIILAAAVAVYGVGLASMLWSGGQRMDRLADRVAVRGILGE